MGRRQNTVRSCGTPPYACRPSGLPHPAGHGGPGRQFGVAQQDQEVLHDGDQVVLYALTGEATPAGALEAVLRGGPSEAAFEQPLAPPSIPPPRGAMGLRTGQVEQFLVGITLERPPRFGPCAMSPQRAGRAYPARRAVFVIATSRVIVVAP